MMAEIVPYLERHFAIFLSAGNALPADERDALYAEASGFLSGLVLKMLSAPVLNPKPPEEAPPGCTHDRPACQPRERIDVPPVAFDESPKYAPAASIDAARAVRPVRKSARVKDTSVRMTSVQHKKDDVKQINGKQRRVNPSQLPGWNYARPAVSEIVYDFIAAQRGVTAKAVHEYVKTMMPESARRAYYELCKLSEKGLLRREGQYGSYIYFAAKPRRKTYADFVLDVLADAGTRGRTPDEIARVVYNDASKTSDYVSSMIGWLRKLGNPIELHGVRYVLRLTDLVPPNEAVVSFIESRQGIGATSKDVAAHLEVTKVGSGDCDVHRVLRRLIQGGRLCRTGKSGAYLYFSRVATTEA
jgi:predicted transcriptional regulator